MWFFSSCVAGILLFSAGKCMFKYIYFYLQITNILLSVNTLEIYCLGLTAVRPLSQRGANVLFGKVRLPGLDFIAESPLEDLTTDRRQVVEPSSTHIRSVPHLIGKMEDWLRDTASSQFHNGILRECFPF